MIIPRFSPSLDAKDMVAFIKGASSDDDAVSDFEKAFAKRVERKHAIVVPSARAGLYFLLKTCGCLESPILIPALTYHAIPAVADLAGFKPHFIDIRADTLLMDEDLVEKVPDGEVGAIIPTHLYGRVQNMDRIMDLARARDWLVIEDVAQGLGANWRGKPCGSFGDAAYFTFGPTKNFTTLGGGMIACDDDDWASRIRDMMKPVRQSSRFDSLTGAAYGFAMSVATTRIIFSFALYPLLGLLKPSGIDIIEAATADPPKDYPLPPKSFYEGGMRGAQAHVGMNQLKKLDMLGGKRRANVYRLLEYLEGVEGIRIPRPRDGEESVYMSFPVLVDDPDELSKRLIRLGVDTTRGYMSYCAQLAIFKDYARHCPVAADAAKHMLHLPVHAKVSSDALGHIARSVRSSLAFCT